MRRLHHGTTWHLGNAWFDGLGAFVRACGHHQDVGLWAEQQVRLRLESCGWRCLAQRWRCRYGELDLVMVKEGRPQARLLMVEVKARRRCGPDGWGVAAFGVAKRRRLARSLACWRMDHPFWESATLEVVLALVQLSPHPCVVRWRLMPDFP